MRPERPERIDLRPERLILRPDRPDFRPERAELRPEGLNDGETNGWTDERKSPCVLQDFVPFRAAAQKRIKDEPF